MNLRCYAINNLNVTKVYNKMFSGICKICNIMSVVFLSAILGPPSQRNDRKSSHDQKAS